MNYLLIIFIFLIGLAIGSFINCLVYRLHEEKSMFGRSFCPHCKKHIAWYDNIPVLSFFILRATCRKCRKKISWQYPIVELVAGLLFILAWYYNFGLDYFNMSYELCVMSYVKLLRDFFIISIMIIIFIYDLKWYLILDRITLPAAGIVLIFNLILGFNLWNLLFSGIIGGSFFLLQFIISRGKWIGGGDIRLGLLMGFALGWPMVILAIFLAYIIGSVIGIGLLMGKKKKWGSEIPLGVFLTTATIIILFWGEFILNWYQNIIFF